jgi:glycosyltransferase involved in cell wall biosynthesis
VRLLYAFPEPLPLPKARGIQVAWMVDALCAAGVEVTLVHVPSAQGHPLAPLGPGRRPAGLRTLALSRNWPFPFQRWHSVSRFCRLLLVAIDRDGAMGPDVVFVRHLKLAYRLLRERPELPLIYEAHEVFAAGAKPSRREALAAQEAYVLQHAAGVVAISGAVRNALHREYAVGGRELTLHSGVDLPPDVPEKDWAACARHIVYAGSFFAWKGVDDLVAAAAHLPGARITLIGGEEEDLARLRRQIDPTGAEVVLLPRMPADRVMAHLLGACIAVLPNRSEGVSQFTSPLKLFEYMGAGCAVVAADLPSVREVLGADDAAWFAPGDSRALAAALKQLLADPRQAQEQGERLRRMANRYTWLERGRVLADFAAELIVAGARRESA